MSFVSPARSGTPLVRTRLSRAASLAVEALERRQLMTVSATVFEGTTEVDATTEGTEINLVLSRDPQADASAVKIDWGDGLLVEHAFTGNDSEMTVPHVFPDNSDPSGPTQIVVHYKTIVAGPGTEETYTVESTAAASINEPDQPDTTTSGYLIRTAADPTGRVVTAAPVAGSADVIVRRYEADGDLDTSFGTGGYAVLSYDGEDGTNAAGPESVISAVAATAAGDVYVAVAPQSNGALPRIARLSANGSAQAEVVFGDEETPLVIANALAATNTGVIFAGTDGSGVAVGRLLASGSGLTLDTTFGPDDSGVVVQTLFDGDGLELGGDAQAVTIANNQIVIAAQTMDLELAILRFDLDGGPAADALLTGVTIERIGGIVPADVSGGVYVAANTRDEALGDDVFNKATDILLARFTAGNLPDETFGGDYTPPAGINTSPLGGGYARASYFTDGFRHDDQANGLAVVGERIVVTGSTTRDINFDSQVATVVFDEDGRVTEQFAESAGTLQAGYAVVQDAGDVVVHGIAEGAAGVGRGRVITRLNRESGTGGEETVARSLTKDLQVANVAPTVSAGAAVGIAGQSLSFDVTVTEPGTKDVVTLLVRYGDGVAATGTTPAVPETTETVTIPAVFPGDAQTRTVTLDHVYARGGNYVVTIEAKDDEDATIDDVKTAAVKVITVTQPTAGTLAIGGTGGADKVRLAAGADGLTLIVDDEEIATFADFAGRITIDAGGGNDDVRLAGLTVGADVFGGDGNDVIVGGDAGGVLSGGDGVDTITGGAWRDILIGGRNADGLVGGGGEDVLLGGRTSFDNNAAALDAIRTAWHGGRSFGQRVSSLSSGNGVDGGFALRTDGGNQTVFDDGASDRFAFDVLFGGTASDWYLYNYQQGGPQDVVIGFGGGDTRSDTDAT